jgi:hypothetical protein
MNKETGFSIYDFVWCAPFNPPASSTEILTMDHDSIWKSSRGGKMGDEGVAIFSPLSTSSA